MKRTTSSFFLVSLILLSFFQFQSCTKKDKLKIKVKSITLLEKQGELYVDDQMQLIATILPKDAAPIDIKWESDNTKIAKVDELGEITALAIGSAIITIKSDDTDKTDNFNLIIKKRIIKINSIKIIKSEELITNKDTIIEDQDAKLTTKILPINSDNKTCTWSTSNNNIATVDQEGKVHAVKAGDVTIKVVTEDGGKTDKCKLTIKAKRIAIKEIKINSVSRQVTEGKELQLTGTVIPDNADDKNFTWSVDNKEIATIDQTGKLKAIKVGTVNIKAIAARDGVFGAYTITITKSILISEIKINSPKERICEGEELQLIGIIEPENADYKELIWSVDKQEIATIDQTGKLVSKAVGTVKVTAKAADKGGVSNEYEIEVFAKTISVTGIKINPINEEPYIGKEISVSATLSPINPTNPNIYWYTSDEEKAAFDENGKLKCLTAGKVKIKAVTEDGEKYDDYEIEIKARLITNIKISTTKDTENIFVKDIFSFTSVIEPTDATYPNVIWSTSNEEIATIDQEGSVIAKKEGSVIVIATSKDGNAFDEYEIQIKNHLVTNITINKPENIDNIFVRDEIPFSATVIPECATNKNVIWTIENIEPSNSEQDAIATFENGKLIAKGKGKVRLITTSEDGNAFAECEIEVKNVHVETVEINMLNTREHIYIKDNPVFVAKISPENSTNKKVSWSVINKNSVTNEDNMIASIDQNGQLIAIRPGIAIITVISQDGKISNNKEITIEESETELTGISINKSEYELTPNNDIKISYNLIPESATNTNASWSSSQTDIATIDQEGNIHPIKDGTTTITVYVAGFEATCVVIVTTPLESIHFEKDTYELKEGMNIELNPIFTPENPSNKEISTWESNHPEIASVSDQGLVKAVKAGETTITATIKDGENTHTARCTFTISAGEYVSIQGVSFNIKDLFITTGETKDIVVIFDPINATDQEVTYESKDETIATVDEQGRITAIKEGKVIMSVKTQFKNKPKELEFVITRFKFEEWKLFSILLNRNRGGEYDTGIYTDRNEDCILSDSEINKTKKLDLSYFRISSLKGIEIFRNLEDLDCSNNILSSLDLSKCSMLTKLNCKQKIGKRKSILIGKIYLHPDVYELAKNNRNFIKNDEDEWAVRP